MDTQTLVIWYLISAVFTLIILYYLIKGAVRNGIIEAKTKLDRNDILHMHKTTAPPNNEQQELINQYERGDLTFEAYQQKWDALNTN